MNLDNLRLPFGIGLRAHAGSPVRAFAWAQYRTLAVGSLAGLFLVLHLAWFTSTPGDLDEFNFALGVRDFDVVHNQPHPPGAPVYIGAGKISTWLWKSFRLPFDPLAGPEAAALAALSLVCGLLLIGVLWRADRWYGDRPSGLAYASLIAASAPLFWLLAARPLSDLPGLLLVLLVYASIASDRHHLAALLAGIAAGVRIQTALLTVPLLIIGVRRTGSWKSGVMNGACFIGGILAWLLPMLAASQGLDTYWSMFVKQTQYDWANPLMFAAAPTLRNGAAALVNTFARPWGDPVLAALMLAVAALGAYRLVRSSRRLAVLCVSCVAPYLIFHLVFQETATIRYSLPITLAIVCLAGLGIEGLPRAWRVRAVTLVLVANLVVSIGALRGFQRTGSPSMRLFAAMQYRVAVAAPAFVAWHENLKLSHLQRILPPPARWTSVRARSPYEWRALAAHWKNGATAPIWFVADPRRTDLTLIDRHSQHVLGNFRLSSQSEWMLRGVRPGAFTWIEMRRPSWIAMRGFALTPATGGVAAADREGPAFDGAVALIARQAAPAVMAVGGRHVGAADDPAVRVVVEVDGRPVGTVLADPQARQYRALIHLGAEQLAGDSPYATVTIQSSPVTPWTRLVPVTVEQFEYQSQATPSLSFESGWHEPELRQESGLMWRWAARNASLRIHRDPTRAVELTLAGDAHLPRGFAANVISVVAGGRKLDEFSASAPFSRRILIPAGLSVTCDLDVTLTSSSSFIPHEIGESEDRRELAFRAFQIEVNPVGSSRPRSPSGL